MDVEDLKKRYIRGVEDSIASAQQSLSRLSGTPSVEDIQALRNIQNQAAQAVQEVNQLIGALEAERYGPKQPKSGYDPKAKFVVIGDQSVAVKPECHKCKTYNPKGTTSYRCAVRGSCPGKK